MNLKKILTCLLFYPLAIHASFIESTMGTAVVNDATATYHNPAALMLLDRPQFIALGSVASYRSSFTGQAFSYWGGVTQSGQSKGQENYYLPSLYITTPIQNNIRIGVAVLSDKLNSGNDQASILRYAKPNSQINNIDITPAIGLKLNELLSIGAGFSYSDASFTSNPITGIPSLNIPDSKSHNVASDHSFGGNAGFVIKPNKSTLIGFNYRSSVSYQFYGRSSFQGTPAITSNNYHFDFWTPARSVLTLSHFLTPDLGFISTVQRVQWSIFNQVTIHGIATQVGTHSIIVPEAIVPYHFHDTWTLTMGGIKNITPQWVVRLAATYDQSPSNGNFQITKGDGLIIGASTGYEVYKHMIIDGSFSHAFLKNQPINIASRNNLINGVNSSYGNSASLKLTVNL